MSYPNANTISSDVTAELIIQGYINDSKLLFEESQGQSNGQHGDFSDFQMALRLNQEEMERNSGILRDRLISESIANAVIADAQPLAESQAQEAAMAEDRRVRHSGLKI